MIFFIESLKTTVGGHAISSFFVKHYLTPINVALISNSLILRKEE